MLIAWVVNGGMCMTRDEAIELLRSGPEGVAEWNRWIDDLPGRELPNLIRADLKNAEIIGAKLVNAELREANLSGANLILSELCNTDFRGANLRMSSLVDTNLYGADFRGADLSRANFGYSSITNVNLSGVIGLEEVKHHGPSSIGVDTLIKSGGKIQDDFLRGCGVPEEWIAYLPSLLGSMEPIQYYSCFISHSSKDKAFCSRLHSRMRDEKLRVWYAPEDMKGGDLFFDQIDRAIRVHDKLLLVLSKRSMESEWVVREVERARKREKAEGRRVLFPIRLCSMKAIKEWERVDADTGEDIAKVVRGYHIPDFSGWKDHDSFEKGFADLMHDLRAGEGGGEGEIKK